MVSQTSANASTVTTQGRFEALSGGEVEEENPSANAREEFDMTIGDSGSDERERVPVSASHEFSQMNVET